MAYLYSYHWGIRCPPIELVKVQAITGMDRQEGLEAKHPAEYFKERLEMFRKRNKKTFDKSGEVEKRRKFELGDLVWYKLRSPVSDKLSPKWIIKGKVLQKGVDSYKVRLEDRRIVLSNKKHLKNFLIGRSFGILPALNK